MSHLDTQKLVEERCKLKTKVDLAAKKRNQKLITIHEYNMKNQEVKKSYRTETCTFCKRMRINKITHN